MKQGKVADFSLLVPTRTPSVPSYLNGKGERSCLLQLEQIVELKVNEEMLDPETLLPFLGRISDLDWKANAGKRRLFDIISADNNVFEPESSARTLRYVFLSCLLPPVFP